MQALNTSTTTQSHAVHLIYDMFYLNHNALVVNHAPWQSQTTQLLLAISKVADQHLSEIPFLFDPFRMLFSIGGLTSLATKVEKYNPNAELVHYVKTLKQKNNIDAKTDHDRLTGHIYQTIMTQTFTDLLAAYHQVDPLSRKLRRIDSLYDTTLISKQLDYEIWVMLRKLLLNYSLFKQFTLADFTKLKSFELFCEFIDKTIEKKIYFEPTNYIKRDYIDVIKATLGADAPAYHERVFMILLEA